jgi:hypothetical protein
MWLDRASLRAKLADSRSEDAAGELHEDQKQEVD